jgi:hypothetical protein
MASQRILASFDNLQQARRAVHALEAAGVSRRMISVATPDRSTGEGAVKRALHFPIRVGIATRIGIAAGATVLFLAVALVHAMVPSYGPVFALGGLLAVLGALMGGLAGYGMDSIAAGQKPPAAGEAPPAWEGACSERLQRGDVVVAVSTSQEKAERATAVLSPQGAREVCRVG